MTGTVDFANSDAALTPAQVTSYRYSAIGTASGPLIQIPYVVTPITIPLVNAPPVTSTLTPQTTPNQANSIALNDNDLCGIFSGKINDWKWVINPETGTAYSMDSRPITVVYRQDASGETELLTRHLAAVCTSSNTAFRVTFVDSMTFANTWAFPAGMPLNFVAATNSVGVRNALLGYRNSWSGPAAISYLGPADTNTFLAPSSSVAAQSQLQVASLFNTTNRIYYAPTGANASVAFGQSTLPPTGQSATSPASDPTQWVPVSGTLYAALANPSAGYPVSGTSQIILNQCYADANVTKAVSDFLSMHYNNASFASIVRGNGFNTVPQLYSNVIITDFLTAGRGNTLNIGNSKVCNGEGR
nr:Phosphate-binding protein [Paraburkholderia busanensis]